MLQISRELGVSCTECHLASNFKDPSKNHFKVAVAHKKWVQVLKDSGMDGKNGPEASCYTCHQGRLKFAHKMLHPETDKKEKERKNNIYMIYPRSFENEITLEIPAGYTVAGLDKLNKKVENETGGFVSSAVVTGNKLVIRTNKYYKNYYEPNSNWTKMIQFLDASYQFTQEKVLLKKN